MRLIAGLLHLGNISFEGEDEAAVKGECAGDVANMREMLGMPGHQSVMRSSSERRQMA